MIIAALDSAVPSLGKGDVLRLVVLPVRAASRRAVLLGRVVLDGLAWCYDVVVVDVVQVVVVVVVGVVVVVVAVVDVVVDVAAGVVAAVVDVAVDVVAVVVIAAVVVDVVFARSLVGSTTKKRESKRVTIAEKRQNGMT